MSDARFWNKAAERYARQPVANPEAFERKIEVTLSRMTPQSVVLDIGCGTGSLALRLAPSAGHVHGLDVSTEMIRIARRKTSDARVDNVSFHVGAFDDSFAVFDEASLDGICAYSLLHLLENRQAALARIHRLLKPGGFFVASTVCLGESRLPFAPLLWLMRRLGMAPKVSVLDKRTHEIEVAKAGFVDLVQPDVGVKPTIMFLTATKPLTTPCRDEQPDMAPLP
ncbi:class I SAM-dependent methyltransferase [Marilutibacter alkalisoli]|uniref:Class I SAM-dependent methyltransferase n=1 Tax=Marilutibacter alkalisoli TaxID=2591633 RepID=A0A514BQM6_9GAMM|nr:class I SAM-dependent methyltransferase [Lysobacter alkalisoli]QDH69656.1 class I SAM-dependent methyltransferase [Lysobacter alkalisoli]